MQKIVVRLSVLPLSVSAADIVMRSGSCIL